MSDIDLTILFASIVAGAAPVLLATLGETISQKAGVINLSLDGSILLSGMAGFAIAFETGNLVLGFMGGAIVGALVALIIAVFSIYLHQPQVAVGFVLTLMTRDLAYFIGNPYSGTHGPQVLPMSIPFLKDIPFVGDVFFNHNFPVYLSLVLIGLIWWYFFKTPAGLNLQSIGEHPRASFSRGINPQITQLIYVTIGGALVGLAGATFTLSTKAGWGRPQGAEGAGWIALALVIFGGWNPVKAAIGAYLFSFLQVMGIHFQGWFPSIPNQVFQVAPFPLMILMLLIMSLSQKEGVKVWSEKRPLLKAFLGKLGNTEPSALGQPYKPDEY